MKKILTFIIAGILSFVLLPMVKALDIPNNYLEIKLYEKDSIEDFDVVEISALNFLFDRDLIKDNCDDIDGTCVTKYNDKTIFISTRDEVNQTIKFTIAEGITAEDNIEYTFTEEDMQAINALYVSDYCENCEMVQTEPKDYLYNYAGVRILFEGDCENNTVCIISTKLDSASDSAIINEPPLVEGLSVSFDVSLKNVNDQVKYKIIVKNKTNEDYKLNVNNFKKSDYITYSYSFESGNNTLKANSNTTLFVTIKYEHEVPQSQLMEGFTETNTLVLSTNKDIVNPKTGDFNQIAVILGAIVVLLIMYAVVSKKQPKYTLSLLFIALLIPIVTNALKEVTIKVNTSVEIRNGSIIESRDWGSPKKATSTLPFVTVGKDFWLYNSKIKSITFDNRIVEPETYAYKFDVSEEKDNSIIAYLVQRSESEDYDLYIMSNGIIFANPDSSNWFADMPIERINGLQYFNTTKVENMAALFADCNNLTSIDLSYFDTSNVTNMADMFAGCSNLTSLNIRYLNTQNVTDMTEMFDGCSSLATLDFSHFDTRNVTRMAYMFAGTKFTALDLSHFNTSNVTVMEGMFANCTRLATLNLLSFDTSKVTNMVGMFGECESLVMLDLSSFNTGHLVDANVMFDKCRALTTIYVGEGWTVTNVNSSVNMFGDCTSIKGSSGTTYDANHTDKEYARYDLLDTPGYLTPAGLEG